MLWNITGTNHQVLGSIHALPECTSFPAWAEHALNGKSRVVFEADVTDPSLASDGIDIEGNHLSYPNASRVYEDAAAILAGYGNVNPFDALKPWRAAFYYIFSILATKDIYPKNGADHILRTKAEENQLDIQYLEKPTRVFDIFRSSDEPYEYLRFFENAVYKTDENIAEFFRITKAWLNRDIDDLESLLEEKKRDFPEIFIPLISQRNREWITSSKEYLESETPTLFVVGALHLVGNDSFLKHLEQQGMTVEIHK